MRCGLGSPIAVWPWASAGIRSRSRSCKLASRIYVVLRARDGSGPWIARTRAEYVELVGTFEERNNESVSRAFPSDTEGRAYFWGSGLPLALAPSRRN